MVWLSHLQFSVAGCRCRNITATRDNGDHVLTMICCAQCWEMGQRILEDQLTLEVDVVFEPPPPAPPDLFPS